MSTFATLIDHYLMGVASLRTAVEGMTRDQILARPIPGRWSTLEVVCHLADFEPIHADRMKRVIAENNPQFFGADETRFANTLAYHQRDLEEELQLIAATRSQMARILQSLLPETYERLGTHNERGPLTLEQLVSISINHIPHHLRFVAEKRRILEV